MQPDPLLHALGTGVRREPGRFEHRAARFVGWWRGGELPSFVEDRDGKIGWAGPRRSRRVRSDARREPPSIMIDSSDKGRPLTQPRQLQGPGPASLRTMRGTERGRFVAASKKGDGAASPRIHQPNITYARRPKTLSEGGPGAFDGSGPVADRS